MKARLEKWLTDAWYSEMYLSPWLTPFSMFYADAVRLRRFLYRIRVLRSVRLPVPVIMVGNLTVGGSGKTPLVIWLAELLRREGYRPGVVSRGYGGGEAGERLVAAGDAPAAVGDEAVLLSERCGCPVAVGRDRPAAARLLLAQTDCNLIISDDGLQHYALQRDIEIIVVDGQRYFGNGYCLPAGPLREPQSRLMQANLQVVNGGEPLNEHMFIMQCLGQTLVNLQNGEHRPLADFRGQSCHALAAIGNPKRFFKQLEAAGLDCRVRAYPDHYLYQAEDLRFAGDAPLIMTEKDAVKCRAFARPTHWYLPVTAELPPAFAAAVLNLLWKKNHG